MIIYTLFYYDRPLLKAWLSHYCQFKCVNEIIIQDQNWSVKDTLFLLDTVAEYVDTYGKKIVVLPSRFKRLKGKSKRLQFLHYGQSKIRNRVLQFLEGTTFIASSMDEVIYGSSYRDTETKLRGFEELAEERAKTGKSTVGFVPLYCVWKDAITPCNGIPISRWKTPSWRHRLFRFTTQFRRKGSKVHDTTYEVLKDDKWVKATPGSATTKRGILKRYKQGVALELKLLHYHTLVRSSFESSDFLIPDRSEVDGLKQHPKAYIEKLLPRERRKQKVVKQEEPVELEAVFNRWKKHVGANRREGRAWYYGVPYKWWWGMSGQSFLDLLRKHLDREKEPVWFQ